MNPKSHSNGAVRKKEEKFTEEQMHQGRNISISNAISYTYPPVHASEGIQRDLWPRGRQISCIALDQQEDKTTSNACSQLSLVLLSFQADDTQTVQFTKALHSCPFPYISCILSPPSNLYAPVLMRLLFCSKH